MRRVLKVAIAIIRRDDRVLICRRKDDDSFGGYWEFPGGKLESGEPAESCIAREIREELAVEIRLLKLLPLIDHDYPRVRVRLYPFIAEIAEGEPQMIECSELRWVKPQELRGYRFPGANQRFISTVLRLLGCPSQRGRAHRRRHRGNPSIAAAAAGQPANPAKIMKIVAGVPQV